VYDFNRCDSSAISALHQSLALGQDRTRDKQASFSKRLVTLAIAAFLSSIVAKTSAFAGAWTLPEDQTQLIETTTYSYASVNFDSHGSPTEPVVYRKLLTSLYAEYGWNDWLTLVAEPEYAHAIAGAPNKLIQRGNDFAMAAGARVRLFNDIGMLSVQLLAKSAGAFDMTTSFDQAGGAEIELRALYGTNFQLFGHDGFVDAEIAQRFIGGRRPDETAADLTVGYNFKKTQMLLQSFNIIATGGGRPPYSFFRSHKIAISTVMPLWRMFRLQTGSYFSPGGQNALAEKGLFAAIWVSF
jgi:hypothetical protein